MSYFKFLQRLAPVWAELAVQYAHNEYIQIGKVNCMENEMTCKNFDIKLYPYLLWVVNGRIVSFDYFHFILFLGLMSTPSTPNTQAPFAIGSIFFELLFNLQHHTSLQNLLLLYTILLTWLYVCFIL